MKQKFAWFLTLCLLCIAARSAHAQIPARIPVSTFQTTSGANITTYAAGTINAAQAAGLDYKMWNDALAVDSTSRINLPNNRTLDVVARTVPTKPDTAKAVGTFLRGAGGSALKLATTVYVVADFAYHLNTLCNDLGYNCYKGADGTVTVDKQGDTTYSWTVYAGGPVKTVRASTASGACVAAGGSWSGSSCAPWFSIPAKTGNPVTDPAVPSTIQELEDAIASKSGWPSSTSLPKVVEQSVASGHSLPVPAPSQITGPSTVPGPTSTETTPAQNGQPASSKTTSTVNNITYSPTTVTNNQVVTTVVNNGSTITTTTEQKEPEPSPTDTANPDLPKLYTRKYPDGLPGVWTTRKAELLATSLPSLIQSLTPTIVSGAGCPQFSIPLNLGKWQWGTYSLGPACYVWDFLKVCVLIGAVFLARALVFGG